MEEAGRPPPPGCISGASSPHLPPQQTGAAARGADCEDWTLGLVTGTPPPGRWRVISPRHGTRLCLCEQGSEAGGQVYTGSCDTSATMKPGSPCCVFP